MNNFDIKQLSWNKVNELMPAIIQDANTGDVLMLGYMNQQALDLTTSTQKVTFYSRTKQALWVKGETSGHYLNVVDITIDCDQDALLIQAIPEGPTCHRNTRSCFNSEQRYNWQVLSQLDAVITQRAETQPTDSYTASLLNKGINKIAQKVGEEGVETVIAALKEDDQRLCSEASDLLYHVLVLFKARGLSLKNLLTTLETRLDC